MIRKFTLALLITILCACPALASGLKMAVIQPGQPGSTQEAGPVMDKLAAYLGKRTGLDVSCTYVNQMDQAVEYVLDEKPDMAIVSMPFFTGYAAKFGMVPVASTLPGGKDQVAYRLLAPKGSPKGLDQIKGIVASSAFYPPRAASCLIFSKTPDALGFELKPTARPMRFLRKTVKGKIAGTVVDSLQFSALSKMDIIGKLDVVYESAPVPTSPVVRFGPENDRVQKAVDALLNMAKDNDLAAGELIRLLQTAGFGPANKAAVKMVMENENGPCFIAD